MVGLVLPLFLIQVHRNCSMFPGVDAYRQFTDEAEEWVAWALALAQFDDGGGRNSGHFRAP